MKFQYLLLIQALVFLSPANPASATNLPAIIATADSPPETDTPQRFEDFFERDDMTINGDEEITVLKVYVEDLEENSRLTPDEVRTIILKRVKQALLLYEGGQNSIWLGRTSFPLGAAYLSAGGVIAWTGLKIASSPWFLLAVPFELGLASVKAIQNGSSQRLILVPELKDRQGLLHGVAIQVRFSTDHSDAMIQDYYTQLLRELGQSDTAPIAARDTRPAPTPTPTPYP